MDQIPFRIKCINSWTRKKKLTQFPWTTKGLAVKIWFPECEYDFPLSSTLCKLIYMKLIEFGLNGIFRVYLICSNVQLDNEMPIKSTIAFHSFSIDNRCHTPLFIIYWSNWYWMQCQHRFQSICRAHTFTHTHNTYRIFNVHQLMAIS